MNVLIWSLIYFFIALLIFGAGYLFVAREFGKDVKFYKNCIHTLRLQMQTDSASANKTEEEYQVAAKGLILWVEQKVEKKQAQISYTVPSTLDNAFARGEKFGLWSVLLHLKGYL